MVVEERVQRLRQYQPLQFDLEGISNIDKCWQRGQIISVWQSVASVIFYRSSHMRFHTCVFPSFLSWATVLQRRPYSVDDPDTSFSEATAKVAAHVAET